jgi:hypothetical protein
MTVEMLDVIGNMPPPTSLSRPRPSARIDVAPADLKGAMAQVSVKRHANHTENVKAQLRGKARKAAVRSSVDLATIATRALKLQPWT